MEVDDGSGAVRPITAAADLDELLDRIDEDARRAGRPRDVRLDAGAAGVLGVVVGHERSVLNHVPADGEPPYRTSRGELPDDGTLVFWADGDHHTEASLRSTVPVAVAREAARRFMRDGRLDERVTWVEV